MKKESERETTKILTARLRDLGESGWTRDADQTTWVVKYQGFLQLDDNSVQPDPPLRIIGSYRETLECHNIQMLQKEG